MKRKDMFRILASTFFFGLAFFIFTDQSFISILGTTFFYFLFDLIFNYFILKKME